jgi:hypothetical protein
MKTEGGAEESFHIFLDFENTQEEKAPPGSGFRYPLPERYFRLHPFFLSRPSPTFQQPK